MQEQTVGKKCVLKIIIKNIPKEIEKMLETIIKMQYMHHLYNFGGVF